MAFTSSESRERPEKRHLLVLLVSLLHQTTFRHRPSTTVRPRAAKHRRRLLPFGIGLSRAYRYLATFSISALAGICYGPGQARDGRSTFSMCIRNSCWQRSLGVLHKSSAAHIHAIQSWPSLNYAGPILCTTSKSPLIVTSLSLYQSAIGGIQTIAARYTK